MKKVLIGLLALSAVSFSNGGISTATPYAYPKAIQKTPIVQVPLKVLVNKNTRIIGQENTRLLDQNKRIIKNKNNIQSVAKISKTNIESINENIDEISNVKESLNKNSNLTKANEEKVATNAQNITINKKTINSLKTKAIQTRATEGAIVSNIKINNNNTLINGNEIKILDAKTLNNQKAIVANQRTTATNTENIKNNSHRIDMNSNKIDSVQEESRQGISGVSAIAGIKYQNMTTGQAQIGVGYGNYKSESSIAIGTAVQATDNLMINGAVSGVQGNNTSAVYSAGASYKFNLFI